MIFLCSFPLQKAIIFENMLIENNITFNSLRKLEEGFELKEILIDPLQLKKGLNLKEIFEKEELTYNLSQKHFQNKTIYLKKLLAIIVLLSILFYNLYKLIQVVNND